MTLISRVFEYLVLSLFVAPLTLKFSGMDRKGSGAAFLVGFIVYISTGFKGFLLLLSLHLIGAAATFIGYDKKQKIGVSQKKRTFGNVIANGFFPSLAATLSVAFNSHSQLLYVGFISTIAAATADTVAGEIGELSDKKPLLITTLKKVETGTNGGISLLGTLSGLIASAVIALIAYYAGAFEWRFTELFLTVTLVGLFGTTVDSLLGATLERQGKIGNDMVNLSSTGLSFLASVLLYSLLA